MAAAVWPVSALEAAAAATASTVSQAKDQRRPIYSGIELACRSSVSCDVDRDDGARGHYTEVDQGQQLLLGRGPRHCPLRVVGDDEARTDDENYNFEGKAPFIRVCRK